MYVFSGLCVSQTHGMSVYSTVYTIDLVLTSRNSISTPLPSLPYQSLGHPTCTQKIVVISVIIIFIIRLMKCQTTKRMSIK